TASAMHSHQLTRALTIALVCTASLAGIVFTIIAIRFLLLRWLNTRQQKHQQQQPSVEVKTVNLPTNLIDTCSLQYQQECKQPQKQQDCLDPCDPVCYKLLEEFGLIGHCCEEEHRKMRHSCIAMSTEISDSTRRFPKSCSAAARALLGLSASSNGTQLRCYLLKVELGPEFDSRSCTEPPSAGVEVHADWWQQHNGSGGARWELAKSQHFCFHSDVNDGGNCVTLTRLRQPSSLAQSVLLRLEIRWLGLSLLIPWHSLLRQAGRQSKTLQRLEWRHFIVNMSNVGDAV
ncbi:hypothetical protein BOX15_Mlig009204g1, partial [Macrostomum lignano]